VLAESASADAIKFTEKGVIRIQAPGVGSAETGGQFKAIFEVGFTLTRQDVS
jgi:hypothetical protein